VRGGAAVCVLLMTLVSVPSCLGDVDDGQDEGLAGAGGTPATGGGNPSVGGTGSGGQGSGGEASGGEAGSQATGGFGGEGSGGDIGMGGGSFAGDPSPDDFVTFWEVGYERILRLPLSTAGSYDFKVDWGDGTSSAVTGSSDPDRLHEYEEPGNYAVTIRGVFEGSSPVHCYNDENEEYGEEGKEALLEIRQWGTFRFGEVAGAFFACKDLNVEADDMPDLSPPVTLGSAFLGCWDVSDIPSVGDWDVSQVADMSSLFAGTSFAGDLSIWNTSGVTSMRSMFQSAPFFNGDISGWDTSNVTDMQSLFHGHHPSMVTSPAGTPPTSPTCRASSTGHPRSTATSPAGTPPTSSR
jgi:surface protein